MKKSKKVSELDEWKWCDNRQIISKGQSKKGFFKCGEKGENIYYIDCKNCKNFRDKKFSGLFRKVGYLVKNERALR